MARPVIVRPTTARTSVPLAVNEELDALRRENAALRQALEARRLVERAKGLLMTQGGLSEPDAHRYIQKASMDAGVPMAEVARALILATQARRGPVTTAQIRKSRWPAAAPRPHSFPDALARSSAGRLGSAKWIALPGDSSRLAQRSRGTWPPAAGRP
jgi:ANTAR domain